MKRILYIVSFISFSLSLFAQSQVKEGANGEDLIKNIMKELTLEEKVRMCFGGERFGEVVFPGVPRLNIPDIYGTDGPRGAHIGEVTAFPSGIGLATTWNTELVEQAGRVIGEEGRVRGIGMVLGPAFNINRDPLGGRFFEYFSEDPLISGKIAAAQVRGIQKEGVSACIKHFAANGRDWNRNLYMTWADERTLREIYLKGFEIAVKESEPWGCMTAANGLNGELCSDNQWLLNQVLKKEWGFKGVVLTDFCHSRSTVKAALAGLDIDMPWGNFETVPFGKPLLEAVQVGKVPEEVLDEKIRRILWLRYKLGMLETGKRKQAQGAVNTLEHQEIALKTAEEGLVLLKNEKNFLPLSLNKVKNVVIVGPNCAQRFCIMGLGGSSGTQSPYETTPLKGLKDKLEGKARVTYLPLTGGAEFQTIAREYWTSDRDNAGVKVEYSSNSNPEVRMNTQESKIDFSWFNKSPSSEIKIGELKAVITGKIKAPVTGNYTLRLHSDDVAELWVEDMGAQAVRNVELGVPQSNTAMFEFEAGKEYEIRIVYNQSAEGVKNSTEMNYWSKDNPSLRLEWALPCTEKTIAGSLSAHLSILKKADLIVFVGGSDHNLDCEGRDRKSMNFPQGQTELISQLAKVNNKMVVVLMHGSPLTLPWLDRVPAVLDLFFPGMEGGKAMANALFGDINPSGKLTFSWPKSLEDAPINVLSSQDLDNVYCREKLLVGYRYYDTKKVEPLFPFGFGLSYTTFQYTDLKVSEDGKKISFMLTNTGKREGKEVVQLYVGQLECSFMRPVHELKGFVKVALEAGESKVIEMELGEEAYSFWNPEEKQWMIEGGRFIIEVGSSSHDIRLTKEVRL